MTTGRINQVTIVRASGHRGPRAHRRSVSSAGAISSTLGRPNADALKRQRRRLPQRRPKATVTSPGQRYERQSAPPAKVPRATLLGAKGAESGAPEEGPVPQRLPLRCQLGAGCPLLLSKAACHRMASSPPNPTDGARGP